MRSLNDYYAIVRRHQDSAPVPTVAIAEEMGLKVYRSGGWSDNISGMIRRDAKYGGDSGYAIFVNAQHAEVRRRFTIAHEIGHFVLHGTLIGDGVQDDALYRSGLSGTVEAQANKFAADLLMPWHLVNAAVESGLDDIPSLATKFNVSWSAMAIRIGVPYETEERQQGPATHADMPEPVEA